jgi:hypothetical protein
MDLGSLASYPMPANIRSAFGADTAQQLADTLGIDAQMTPELGRKADAAYGEYKKGNLDAVRATRTSTTRSPSCRRPDQRVPTGPAAAASGPVTLSSISAMPAASVLTLRLVLVSVPADSPGLRVRAVVIHV